MCKSVGAGDLKCLANAEVFSRWYTICVRSCVSMYKRTYCQDRYRFGGVVPCVLQTPFRDARRIHMYEPTNHHRHPALHT